MAKTKKDPIDEIIKVRRKLQSKFANDKTTINSSIIYHYTSPEGILGILTNHTLWLSEITYMNDESEITYTFDLLTDILHITYLIIALSFAGFVSFEISIFFLAIFIFKKSTTHLKTSFINFKLISFSFFHTLS